MTTINPLLLLRNSTFIILPLLLLAGCNGKKTNNNTTPATEETVSRGPQFNADSAYAFCAAQCDFGPRTMNSEAHEKCAEWIVGKFKEYGCDVIAQKATLTGYNGTSLNSTNIIASIYPERTTRILLCAHWDSRPWADNDEDEKNHHTPVMAANDGASGVAVMIELARIIRQDSSLNVGIDFVCFDAEDWGVPQWADGIDSDSWALGAQHWASHFAGPKYEYAILLDMVGGQGAKFYREQYSMEHARNVVEKVWKAAGTAGYGSLFVKKDIGYITDDHVPVNETAHIPCIDVINHYPDCQQSSFGPTWHTVSDDMQHIDKNTLQAVGQTLLQLIYSD